MRIDRFRHADRGFEDLSSCNLAAADEPGDSEPVVFSIFCKAAQVYVPNRVRDL